MISKAKFKAIYTVLVASVMLISCFSFLNITAVTSQAKTTSVTSVEQLKTAFENGGDFVLGENLTVDGESFTVQDGKSVSLDFNGYEITATDTKASGSYCVIQNKGTLILKDTVGTGGISLKAQTDRQWNAYSAVITNEGGILTVESGTYEHSGGTSMAYTIDNNSTLGETILTINGGTFISTYRAIRAFQNNKTEMNSITVNGGTIKARAGIWMQQPGVAVSHGDLTINGGNFTCYSNAVVVDVCGDGQTKVIVVGGEFKNENPNGNLFLIWPLSNASDIKSNNKTSIELQGGKFETAGEDMTIGIPEGADICSQVEVKGGEYNDDSVLDYIQSETVVVKVNGENRTCAVAKVNGIEYITLADAVAVAQVDETILLIKNCYETVSISAGVKFDANGFNAPNVIVEALLIEDVLVERNAENNATIITIIYSNSKKVTTFTVYDGKDGKNGQDGTNGNNGINGKDGTNGVNGVNGKDGLGIKTAEINDNGELLITYTDDTKENLGVIVGSNGQNGINGTDGKDGGTGLAMTAIIIGGIAIFLSVTLLILFFFKGAQV